MKSVWDEVLQVRGDGKRAEEAKEKPTRMKPVANEWEARGVKMGKWEERKSEGGREAGPGWRAPL